MKPYTAGRRRKPTSDELEPFIALSPTALTGGRRPSPADTGAQAQPDGLTRRLAALKSGNDRLRARLERLQAENEHTGRPT